MGNRLPLHLLQQLLPLGHQEKAHSLLDTKTDTIAQFDSIQLKSAGNPRAASTQPAIPVIPLRRRLHRGRLQQPWKSRQPRAPPEAAASDITEGAALMVSQGHVRTLVRNLQRRTEPRERHHLRQASKTQIGTTSLCARLAPPLLLMNLTMSFPRGELMAVFV